MPMVPLSTAWIKKCTILKQAKYATIFADFIYYIYKLHYGTGTVAAVAEAASAAIAVLNKSLLLFVVGVVVGVMVDDDDGSEGSKEKVVVVLLEKFILSEKKINRSKRR
ncbi:hypothetical protein DPMN_053139 [Dreissena polymorpha]|uniref:Uncharacterized protein n=1 Tax=Dreissena polymorpha TaxID=45954 RepID=A0A9D4HQF9_DREPO|nr:hypothetical protein DPMN_053139 [Dreissena polymorpha]